MTNEARKRLPPYISYRTFDNFLNRLQQQIPSRIDRSYWGETLSGSTGIQLMAAMRFLDLVDANSNPTTRLKALVAARGDLRTLALKEVTLQAYDFITRSRLDLQNATYAQLEEVFKDNFQLTGDVARKCIKFFISIATSSSIPLSPFVTKKVRLTHSTISTGTLKNSARKTAQRIVRNTLVPITANVVELSSSAPLHTLLLAKFPPFDPAWSEDVQAKWFDAFEELLKRTRPPVQ